MRILLKKLKAYKSDQKIQVPGGDRKFATTNKPPWLVDFRAVSTFDNCNIDSSPRK